MDESNFAAQAYEAGRMQAIKDLLYPREIDPETTRLLGTFPGTQLTAPVHAALGSPFGRGPSRFAHILGGEVLGGTLGAALGAGAGYGLGRLVDMARGEDSGLFADNKGQKLLGGLGLIAGGLGGSGLGAMYGHRRSMEND